MPFKSLRNFHAAFPCGLHDTGLPVKSAEQAEYPIFAQESLDKLVQDILIPLFTGKRMQSLMSQNQGQQLQLPFVKDVLPELERMYKLELSHSGLSANVGSSTSTMHVITEFDDPLEPISEDEGQRLRKAHQKTTRDVLENAAQDVFKKHVVLFHAKEAGLDDKIAAQPMIKDGSARTWMFNAGLQATRDPRKHQSPFRMKAAMDEDYRNKCVKVYSALGSNSDTAFFVTGRNSAIARSINATLNKEVKPKARITTRRLEPDTDEFMKVCRCGDMKAGSLDPADTMYQVNKNYMNRGSGLKAGPRRFLPGNIALQNFSGIPFLKKAGQ